MGVSTLKESPLATSGPRLFWGFKYTEGMTKSQYSSAYFFFFFPLQGLQRIFKIGPKINGFDTFAIALTTRVQRKFQINARFVAQRCCKANCAEGQNRSENHLQNIALSSVFGNSAGKELSQREWSRGDERTLGVTTSVSGFRGAPAAQA